MGRFAQDFKGYEDNDDSDCYLKSVPTGMVDDLADQLALLCRTGDDSGTIANLQAVTNDLLAMSGKPGSSNWEPGALAAEIRAACHILQAASFDKFMDAMLNAVTRLCTRRPEARSITVREVNRVLGSANFGYAIRPVEATEHLRWESRLEASAGVSSLAATADAVKDISEEAFEHLNQSKRHLLSPDSARSRKDAVRDAMSAMEAMLKRLASEKDFDNACKKLRGQKKWGSDHVVKEGHSTWNLLHEHHPDIRHGQPTDTDITLEEAVYWIERITAYVRYMATRKRLLDLGSAS